MRQKRITSLSFFTRKATWKSERHTGSFSVVFSCERTPILFAMRKTTKEREGPKEEREREREREHGVISVSLRIRHDDTAESACGRRIGGAFRTAKKRESKTEVGLLSLLSWVRIGSQADPQRR